MPRELLLTMQLNGGLVHGAFLADGRLIGVPFFIAGTLKIFYDLLLYRGFARIPTKD